MKTNNKILIALANNLKTVRLIDISAIHISPIHYNQNFTQSVTEISIY